MNINKIKVVYILSLYEENDPPIILGAFYKRKLASRVHEYYYKLYEKRIPKDKKWRLDLEVSNFNGLSVADFDKFVKMFPDYYLDLHRIEPGTLKIGEY